MCVEGKKCLNLLHFFTFHILKYISVMISALFSATEIKLLILHIRMNGKWSIYNFMVFMNIAGAEKFFMFTVSFLFPVHCDGYIRIYHFTLCNFDAWREKGQISSSEILKGWLGKINFFAINLHFRFKLSFFNSSTYIETKQRILNWGKELKEGEKKCFIHNESSL